MLRYLRYLTRPMAQEEEDWRAYAPVEKEEEVRIGPSGSYD